MIRINLVSRRGTGAPGMWAGRSAGVWEVAATAVAVAALVAAAGLVVSEAWSLRRTTRAVTGALAAADADRRERAATAETLEAEEERRARLARQVAQLSRWHETRSASTRMLEAVSRSLPDGLWLTDLRQETDAVVLVGRAVRSSAVFEFASKLESSGQVALPVEVAGFDTAGGGRFEIRVAGLAPEE